MTRFISVDVETTGFDPKSDKIVEISFVENGQIIYYSLINPERRIPPQASQVHGIYNQDVVNAPTVQEAFKEINRLLSSEEEVILIAHNAKFDMKFVSPHLSIKRRWICTYEVSKRLIPFMKKYKLGDLFRNLNLSIDTQQWEGYSESAHRADHDALMCYSLFEHLDQKLKE